MRMRKGTGAIALLGVLSGAVACDGLRVSPCLGDAARVGCQVSLSVQPSRVELSAGATLRLDFPQPGVADYLRDAGVQLTAELVLGADARVPLGAVGPDGRIALPADKLQGLRPGVVQLAVRSTGDGVTVPLRLYRRPALAPVYRGSLEMNEKWAGLRSQGPGKPAYAIYYQKPGSGVNGTFVPYTLTVDSVLLTNSGLVRVVGGFPLSKCSYIDNSHRVTLNGNYCVSAAEIRVAEGGSGSLGVPLSGSPIFTDSQSDVVAFVSNAGLEIWPELANSKLHTVVDVKQVRQLMAVDLNGDGRKEVAALVDTPTGGVARIYTPAQGSGYGEVKAFSDAWSARLRAAAASTPVAAVMGDFDGDGTPELMLAAEGALKWVPSEPDAQFEVLTTLSGTSALVRLESADLNGDGLADLAVVYAAETVLYLNVARR